MPNVAGNIDIEFVNGDNIKLKDIFCTYYPGLTIFAKKYIPDCSACEDIIQDVFISFWENKKKFLNLYAAKAFLYTSVRNCCLDYLKHEKVEKRYIEFNKIRDEATDSFLEEVLKNEAYHVIYQEINNLPEMEKRVLLLALSEKTNEEIAECLNISINTVRTHKARAYKVLRKNLGDLFLLYFFKKSTGKL